MTAELNTALKEAELEIEESTAEIEKALDHLKDEVGERLVKVQKFTQAVKNPILLSAIALLTGIYLGEMARISLEQRGTRI